MALRGVGLQSITTTNAGQPVFGTTVTTAFQVSPDPFTGNTGPQSMASIATVTVASTAVFRQGDKLMVGTAAQFNAAPTTAPDQGQVMAIVDATHMKIKGLASSHGANEFIVLCTTASYIAIQPVGNTAVMYLGEDSTVASGSATLIQEIPLASATAAPPFVLGRSSIGNVYDTGHLWITGTATNQYLPSLNKV